MKKISRFSKIIYYKINKIYIHITQSKKENKTKEQENKRKEKYKKIKDQENKIKEQEDKIKKQKSKISKYLLSQATSIFIPLKPIKYYVKKHL